MTTDEHPKPQTQLAQIAKLPPVFKKGGVVTAASASGICDGAAAVIIASEEAVAKHGLTPLARVVGYGIAGEINILLCTIFSLNSILPGILLFFPKCIQYALHYNPLLIKKCS